MTLNIDPSTISELEAENTRETEKRGGVLLLDDETANLYSLEKILQDDYRVLSFTNPDSALDAFKGNDIDLIITDQRMPTMLGTEFLQKSIEINPNTARIILTGYTDARDLITCINERLIIRFLVKPWTKEDVIDAVTAAFKYLDNERARDQAVRRSRPVDNNGSK